MADSSDKMLTRDALCGKKLFLRPMTPDDVARSYHWILQADPQSLICYAAPCLNAQQAAEQFKAAGKSSSQQSFMVVRTKDNAPIGQAEFSNLNELNRSAEISLLIDPEERKSGAGEETINILCRFLFRYRGLNKVYCQIGSFNEAAIKLLESSGFKRDGVLRHHHFYNGEFHDEYVYSLLLFEFEG